MKLSELLCAERVRHNVEASSKKAVLEILSELLSVDFPSVTTREIFNCLVNREKLGSTGLGQGVAIPHGRINKIEKPMCVFLHLKTAVDFDAPDNKPVDLVFGLIVPEESTDEHLQILSGIAEQFSQPGFAESLRNTHSSGQLLELITTENSS